MRWREALAARPRAGLAAKAALAAALAWLCVQPIGADRYPYYAPFGAVVAVTGTFVKSLRSSTQAVAAILAGAVIATAARVLPIPEVAAIAFVVAAGTLVAGWRRLGEMGSWVPLSSLFILIVGARDPAHYVAAYLGLTTLGAAVGVVVNGIFPPLPIIPTQLALQHLRIGLADQLADLSEGLSRPEPPRRRDWERRRRRLEPYAERVRSLANEAAEARRANWRAARWREVFERQYDDARTLRRLSELVHEVVSLIIERECADVSEVALGPRLRPLTARSLDAMARLLRAHQHDEDPHEALNAISTAIDELRAATRDAWRSSDEERVTAAAIIVDLQRATDSLRRSDSSAA